MAIIQPKIEVPDEIYRAYLFGEVEIKGLAKDAEDNHIIKHLDVVDTSMESDEIDPDNADNEGMAGLAVAALIAVGIAAIAAGTAIAINMFNKKKVNEFKASLDSYIESVQKQSLTVECVDRLISSVDKLGNGTRKKINISFSVEELSALIECLCQHTKHLAEANGVEIQVAYTPEEQEDTLLRLRKNLIYQKQIIERAA